MSKGTQTRERILHQAAVLFNQRGYSGASLADLMEATGLKKGGIYRHFDSKEALAVEAFDYAVDRMSAEFVAAVTGERDAMARLRALIGVYTHRLESSDIPGGCPVMNTAIESDDGNPMLREHARAAMDRLRAFIRRIVVKGQGKGEVRSDVEPDEIASILLSTIQGALMLSGLYKDPIHLVRARQYLDTYLEQQVQAPA